jgi:AraC family transcriptional regulator
MSGGLRTPSASLGLWSGRIFLWPGRALYVGLAADTAVHSHHAIQLCVGLGGNFRLRGGPRRAWREHELAVVAPDRLHQLDGRGALLALVYIDPETDEGRRLTATAPSTVFGRGRREDFEPVIAALRSFDREPWDQARAAEAVAALIERLVPQHARPRMLDTRIVRVLDHVRRTGFRLPAAEAASLVRLSSHRFQHLFRDGTGIPFRRYLLWLRLVDAVEAIAGGASLTTAAHAAGFADSAHLSRTFRRMFGLTPSVVSKVARSFKPSPGALS